MAMAQKAEQLLLWKNRRNMKLTRMLLNGAKNTIDGSVKSTSNLYSENTIVSTFKNY